jgi:uncharacterized membrane protein
MKLNPTELQWIGNKLNSYDIKYQEIYDELYDHLVSAVEQLRQSGDARPVEEIFNDVVSTKFPGYWPFENLVKNYRLAYGKKISYAMWSNFRYYLNWKSLPLVILLIFASYCLPYTRTTSTIMVSTLLVFAGITICYTYFKARKIKTDAGKQSILKGYLIYYSNFPMIFFNLIFNCLGFLSRNWPAASFLNPQYFTPVVFTLILSFFVTYLLANIRLTQQQLENAEIIGRF